VTRWMWKRSHGRASEAPPHERGGYRYVRPTATASRLDSTQRRRPTSKHGRVGLPSVRDSASQHRERPGSNRERLEHRRAGGFFVAEDSTTFPSCRVLYFDRSTRRISRGRETMRDDPWTAANRDKEQLKVTIRSTRKQTAETASPPSKPTVSGPFWTGKKSVPDVPNPQGVIDARQRTDD
jgi:hypothetical protein